ncbi:MAG TPA: nucleotidyltransferase family protein [Candidatus Obscuribacter sp.]|nr:nucleotidyltransferase family protein [Candidatus Obscuribacter sp.]HNB18404.1 nucleotidyltransferase family protein [Candidatus Obscuribacter sp.]HND68285.1 nucleotidyltransferase family protein [Candidatus Obscuribacter sp.]HNG77562.1 nucleotidyltransferase family protein [Candidatus Obscuribacter sp.]HNH76831.1 nucleotidyltransferase family protein [Candidatus Obscuribacter sp.]
MDLSERISKKREQILQVAERYGAQDVRVFGSVARGDFDETSDVDFLIRLDSSNFEGVRYFAVLEQIREELEGILGCKVDVVEEKGLRERIRGQVLAEAIAI